MSGQIFGPLGVLPAAGGGGGSFAQGVLFHGGNPDYLVGPASAPFTGAVNSAKILVSFWFRITNAAGDGTFQIWFEAASQEGLNIFRDNLNRLNLSCTSPGATTACTLITVATFTTSVNTGWHHVYFSLDATAVSGGSGLVGDLYIDGVADHGGGFIQNTANFAFAAASTMNLGARGAGSLPMYADIAALYINYGTYLDGSNSTNMQKFRSVAGHPVNLGTNGATPTGSQPIAFFDNPAATFQNNLGSGGNFSVANGTLTNSSSSP